MYSDLDVKHLERRSKKSQSKELSPTVSDCFAESFLVAIDRTQLPQRCTMLNERSKRARQQVVRTAEDKRRATAR